MKAIRKGDGKEVDVILLHDKEYIDVLPNEHDCRRIYPAETLAVDEVVDWQAFRREAAKDILAGMLSNPERIHIDNKRLGTIEDFANSAVIIADELIRQLKMEEGK